MHAAGYFVSSVLHYLATAEQPGAAALPAEALRSLARTTRSAQAWRAAAGRAGALWRLPRDADGGYAALEDFSTGVTLAPTAAVSEFYNTDAAAADAGGAQPGADDAADDGALPSASTLRPLRAGALRDLVAEAAVWGVRLAEAERALAGDAATAALLTPRAAA
jgi:hypothetical protein